MARMILRPTLATATFFFALLAAAGVCSNAYAVAPRAAVPVASALPGLPAPSVATTQKSEVGNSATTRTKAGGGQNELVVGFASQGTLRAAVCSTPACSPEGGIDLELPAVLAAQRNVTQLRAVALGDGRAAVVVKVPTKEPAQSWQAVVVAVPGQATPKVVFKGYTGYVSGEPGLRQGRQVQISELVDEAGTQRILGGDLHEDLTLCHREALLSPQLLDPHTLELKAAKVQRLTAAEREKAQEIIAQPVLDTSAESSAEPPARRCSSANVTSRMALAVPTPSAMIAPIYD